MVLFLCNLYIFIKNNLYCKVRIHTKMYRFYRKMIINYTFWFVYKMFWGPPLNFLIWEIVFYPKLSYNESYYKEVQVY